MTAKRRDDLGDDLRKVGRPLSRWNTTERTAGIDRNASAAADDRSRKSLICVDSCACGDERRPRSAALSAALTAAAKWQVRGRERPHPPMAIVAPRSLRGVAHALLSLSRVAAAAKRFAYRIRVGFCAGIASPRSAESCPDPCPDRPADRHRSISVTRLEKQASSGLHAPHATGVCCRRSRPSRTRLWSDTHARQASALPRRPVRAAGLTRVRLAPLWPLRDGRHHTDCRRAQFDTRFGLAASDDHAGDSGADRSCGDEAFYQQAHVWIRLR